MIQTHNLSITYGNQPAIRDVTVDIPQGKITAIVGPSGCGKSSFLSAINRMTDLIPAARVEGKIRVDCCDIHDRCRSPTELRKCVGMIFQRPNPFPVSVRRNIQLALREHGMRDRTELATTTEACLRDVGLWEEVKDRLDRPALELSGGQQQRLCIARALALKPQVLLMDEPCSALDPNASATVEELILRLRGRYTLVVVTHNLAQARRIADQLLVFWVRDGVGRVIEQGPTETLFCNATDETTRQYLQGSRG